MPDESAKIAMNRALASSERVAAKAKEVREALTDRSKRATTAPFVLVEIDDEDSLVTTIAAVMASAKHA